MKIQPLMALVVLGLPTVPGARAAVRGFKARNLVPGFLTLACLLVAAPATAQVNYAVSGNTAYVASSPNASGDVVIASTYFGDPVTWIVGCAFCSCTNLTSVTIPYGVTRLGSPSPVFSGCTRLTNISVDAANTTFSSLDGVVFNKAQTTLITFPPGRGSYVIPNSVTSIGSSAFVNCTALTSVTIPNSVIGIGDGAFSGCTSLTNVTIPNGVTGIGQQAFSGCTNLTSVTIGNGVTSIGTTLYSGPFDGCTSLTNFSVDASNPAFSSVNGVVFNKAQATLILFPPGRGGSYVIPASVTNIGFRAFAGTRLTNVTIGNGVTNIGSGAFSGCTYLASVTIPNSVTIIPDRAFENCTGLTSVTIPNGIITIGSDAFNGCTNLTGVTIPDSVTQIGTTLYAGGGNAFANCTSLTNVIIGHSVTNIGTRAFSACSNLTRLTIPASVINLGYAAFYGSSRLTNFTFLGNAPQRIFDMDGGYAQFDSVGAGAKAYYYCGTTGWGASYGGLPTVMLCPPQVNYAVSGDTAYVTSSPNASGDIVVASTFNGRPVTSIGDNSFSGCTGLTSVTIPDSVTQIGTTLYGGPLGFAFYNCTSLTNVIIGNNVTNIGYAAFVHCASLTRLTIPASVINIASSAFAFCTSLTNVTFLGNPPRLLFDFEAGGYWFSNVGPGARAYYYCGTTGWGATYGGLPTVMLCPPQFAPGRAGVKPGGFGFTLSKLTNQTIVVEASAELVNWQPIWTNTLPGASANFVDPEWLQHSNRFYRARSE